MKEGGRGDTGMAGGREIRVREAGVEGAGSGSPMKAGDGRIFNI